MRLGTRPATASASDDQRRPADRGLAARQPRQRHLTPTTRPLPARQPGGRLRRRLPSTTARSTAPVVPPLFTRWITLALNGEIGLRRGPRRHAVSGLQEFLRRRHRLGARLRTVHRWAGRRHTCDAAGRRQAHDRATPSCSSRSRAPATTARLRWFAFVDAGNVYQEREPIRISRAALFGRHRHVAGFRRWAR